MILVGEEPPEYVIQFTHHKNRVVEVTAIRQDHLSEVTLNKKQIKF